MSLAMSPKQQLSRMVAADTFPELTAYEIDALLAYAAVSDSAGREPSHPSWIPTYHLTRAAAEGWKWKMGKVSNLANVRTGDLTHVDSALIRNCELMYNMYARGLNGSAPYRNSAYQRAGTTFDLPTEE
jgi:hypothetical protein